MKDSEPPIVTAPSEDGNEILETLNDEAEVLEPIQEETELENKQVKLLLMILKNYY